MTTVEEIAKRVVCLMGEDDSVMDGVRARMADVFMERFAVHISDERSAVGKYFHSVGTVREDLRDLRVDVKRLLELLGAVAMALDVKKQKGGDDVRGPGSR